MRRSSCLLICRLTSILLIVPILLVLSSLSTSLAREHLTLNTADFAPGSADLPDHPPDRANDTKTPPIALVTAPGTIPLIGALTPSVQPSPTLAPQPATITLNPATTYQTMVGWEATAQAAQPGQRPPDISPVWDSYKDYLMDQAANDLGINRIRVEIKSLGTTNTFDLATFDSTIDYVVNPLRQKLAARGESLWINVTYVHDDELSAALTDPNLYAQQVLATYQHMRTKYGFLPDSWEVALEPDTFNFRTATQSHGITVGNALNAAGDLLQANGFTNLYFVSTSAACETTSVTYFNDMTTNVPTVLSKGYYKELSYHRYCLEPISVLQTIGNLGKNNNLNTSQLEHIGADYINLHNELKYSNVSAWQQYTLAYFGSDTGASYYMIDNTATTPETQVTIASRTKFLRQYFKFIRKGAQRIEAVSRNAHIDPLAFINTDTGHVVVVKASAGGSFSVGNLPEGTYGIKYTTASEYNIDHPDQTLTSGQLIATSIPAAGVITVYQKAGAGGAPLPTPTPVPPTATPTGGVGGSPSATPTPLSTSTATQPATMTATSTATLTPTRTATLTATPIAAETPTATETPTPTGTPGSTATPIPSNTGLRSPTIQGPRRFGDGDGFQVNPRNAFANDNLLAVDLDSGTSTVFSCTGPGKDRHVFGGYGIALPAGAAVLGIEVGVDARVDNSGGSPRMCVQLSWDGGTNWTPPRVTRVLTTTTTFHRLGSPSDTWGRTWTPAELRNATFRVRVINGSSDLVRDFGLDWIPVRVTYRP